MSRRIALTTMIAASTVLAACSDAPADPLTNVEAIPVILDQTVRKTPTDMLETIAGNFYGTFEIAKELGGERAEGWDEARFNSEIETAFAPLSGQIDAAFANNVAGQLEPGEGQAILDTLSEGKNAEYSDCVFNSEGSGSGNRLEQCGLDVGIEPSQELQDVLGSVAGRMGHAIENDEAMAIALGYATCSVLAKFGKEVSTDALTVNLGDTAIGITTNRLPCTDFDALAAQKLTGDLAPNFPETSPEIAE